MKKLSTSNFYAAGTVSSEARRLHTGPCAFSNTTSDTEEVRRATRAPDSCFCTGMVRSFIPGRRRRSYLCRLGTQQDLQQDTGQKMVPRAQHGGVKDQKKPSHKGNIAAQSPQARGERALWCNARNKGGVKKRVRVTSKQATKRRKMNQSCWGSGAGARGAP